MIDVVEEVAEGRARVEWANIRTTYKDLTMILYVFRDAMKFDNVPAMTWDFRPVKKADRYYTDVLFDGVRLPATAEQLQKIADLTGCMLLTPKVIDMLWLQAGTRFNPVTNTARYPGAPPNVRTIVAESHIHVVHNEIEQQIVDAGGDVGKLIESTGKYWCLVNRLAHPDKLLYKERNACNYGWLSSVGRYAAVTTGLRCWQPPGFKHDYNHYDPSQTIRLMYHKAMLIDASGKRELVDLRDVATDPTRAPLISHEGVLHYLRQAVVPAPANDIAMPFYAPALRLSA